MSDEHQNTKVTRTMQRNAIHRRGFGGARRMTKQAIASEGKGHMTTNMIITSQAPES